MPRILRQYGPLILALILLGADVGLIAWRDMRTNDGRLVYTLDDAYIHTAMARNLAEHGVYGVTRHAYGATSSSLGWTLLLAGVFALGATSLAVPLVLNVVFATATLIAVGAVLSCWKAGVAWTAAAVFGILLLVPLPVLVFSGMEHSFQCLVSLGFAFLAAEYAAVGRERTGVELARTFVLGVSAALAVMARFEGGFLVLAACVLLALRRKVWQAGLVGMMGLVPIVVSGLVSIEHGWMFLPNSVLLKGNVPDVTSVGGALRFFGWLRPMNLVRIAHVLVLIAGAAGVLAALRRRGVSLRTPQAGMALIFVGTGVLHVAMAKIGYFFRYEAYLMVLGLVALAGCLAILPRRRPAERPAWTRAAWIAGLVILAAPLLVRAAVARSRVVRATHDIYRQQVQMSRFLAAYYEGEAVAANDIGAINHFADIQCVDLWGLSTLEVARLKLEGRFDTEAIARVAGERDVRIALLYDHWFGGDRALPDTWVRVGRWWMPDNVVCGGDTVSFYAVAPGEADALREHLRAFAPTLPEDVRYLEGDAPAPPESAAPENVQS